MEKSEALIAFCGLFCEDCPGYNGRIPDLARDLRKELRAARYGKFAVFISKYSFGKDFANYEECYKVLEAMVKFRCRKGCRAGGGSPFCKIRKCAERKSLDGCWDCTDYKICDKLEFLEPVHGDAHIKNLNGIKRKGKEGFLEGKKYWYSKLKNKSKQ